MNKYFVVMYNSEQEFNDSQQQALNLEEFTSVAEAKNCAQKYRDRFIYVKIFSGSIKKKNLIISYTDKKYFI